LKKICREEETHNGVISCKSSVDVDETPSVSATVQYIDLQDVIGLITNNKSIWHLPEKWHLFNPEVKNNIIHFYNYLKHYINDAENHSDIIEKKQDIVNLVDKLYYRGGYCFDDNTELVPNIYTTYLALYIMKKVKEITKEPFIINEETKDFLLACFNNSDNLFRFYPYSRYYYR